MVFQTIRMMERLDSMFEKSARSFPGNIAVTFNFVTGKEHVTYQELDVQASKVAEFLRSFCEKREIIGVYSQQSVGLVTCILGVLRHQSCFAPIDENWPPEAICSFLSTLDVSLVLVDKEFIEPFQKCVLQWKYSFPSHDCKVELIRSEVLDANGFLLVRKLPSIDPVVVKNNSLGLAYIMQSSGTTGDPKAVKVPHSCIVPNIADLGNIFQVVPDDVIFLASPYTFDPFIVQMFVAFATGARLVMVPDAVKVVPSKLCEILFDEEKVTIFQPTPSLMHYIGQDLIQSKVLIKHTSLRVLAFGGESCPTLSTLRKWRPPGNNSMIYNLYGITEVSCWALCHLIPNEQLVEERTVAYNGISMVDDLGNVPVDTVNAVPLGVPLLGTDIEIRDEHNEVVEEGMGQIYIGGSDRVCLLGDETAVTAETMRATGDWAFVKDHCIWFCGRKDRQIKRMGKRINLDWIEQEISEKLLNEACSLIIEKSDYSSYSRLHLFVIEKSLPYKSNKVTSLRTGLINLLPVHAQPDFVHVVSHLPMTAHGKVDRKALLSGVQDMPDPEDVKSVREFLKNAWKESLEVIEVRKQQELTVSSKMEFFSEHKDLRNFDENDVAEDDMFIASCGSSLSAVKLADSIEAWISRQQKSPMKLPELLDVILSKPFGALCCYVESKLDQTNSHDDGDFMRTPLGYINAHRGGDLRTTTAGRTDRVEDMYSANGSTRQAGKPSLKRKSSLGDVSVLMDEKDSRQKKAILKNPTSVEDSDLCEDEDDCASELKTCFCSVHRGNQWTSCKFCINSKPSVAGCTIRQTQSFKTFNCKQTFAQSSSVPSEMVAVKCHSLSISSSKETKAPGSKVAITCQWRTCLYKCIDTSPLVVYSPGRCEGEVFIGSHGHVFMCIRLSDGEVLWERRVGDRIESSAALSLCGKYVVVGCYDSKVYVFNHSTGEAHWTFQTGAAVKSSPCIDQQTGVAWVGSHDHHLYGLDITNKQCLFAINCGGGSCFSSPCISNEPHLVFIATLSGLVLAIDATEHRVLWSQQCPKPVFGSPVLIPTGIVCPCVNGFLYCFDFQGKELWRFQTNAPVFCSPSYIGLEHDSRLAGYVVFGSHDKSVYCLSQCGELQWCFTTDAQVYSSPFVAELNVDHLTSCHTTHQRTCLDTACHTTSCKESDLSEAHMAVFVFSTLGTLYILGLYSGVLLGSYSLPGEVFSSPVVVDKQIIVGCRNDYLYSLEMSNTK